MLNPIAIWSTPQLLVFVHVRNTIFPCYWVSNDSTYYQELKEANLFDIGLFLTGFSLR